MMKKEQNINILLCILCLLILLPLLILSTYNRPCADDYDYSVNTHYVVQNGGGFFALIKAAIQTSVIFYKIWQGLYTSAFCLSLQPGIWGEANYSLGAYILLVSMFLFLLGSIFILNKHYIHKSKVSAFVAAFACLTFLVLWMPSPLEGIFWFNGAMNYTPWVFADLFNLCLLLEAGINFHNSKKQQGILFVILSSVLSFIISGANHVTSFENILILLIVSVLYMSKKQYFSLVSLTSACVGFVIMYIAPGTAVRQSSLTQPSIIIAIMDTWKHVFPLLKEWMSIQWFFSLLILTPVVLFIVNHNHFLISFRYFILSLICSFGLICAMLCVPYYAMYNFGAPRIINVIWISFIFLSWFNYTLLWSWLSSYYNICQKISSFSSQKKLFFFTLATIVGIAVILFVPNGNKKSSFVCAMDELISGTAKQYCQEMDARIAAYNNPDLSEVQVSPLKVKSPMLFFNEIGTDPQAWPNTSMCYYYGKPIYLVEDSQ